MITEADELENREIADSNGTSLTSREHFLHILVSVHESDAFVENADPLAVSWEWIASCPFKIIRSPLLTQALAIESARTHERMNVRERVEW